MADLDDFFAKKDRKKTKTKKPVTEEVAKKKLDDTSKEVKPRKEHIENEDIVTEEQPPLPPKVAVPEDEWKDFQEEEQKDYSNLKLGQLTITEEQQNQVNLGQDADEDGQSDGEGLSDSAERRASGPWKKVVPTADGTTEVPIPAPLPVKTTSSVYVSPALRNQIAQGLRNPRLKNRTAPDLNNEEYFPSLGMGAKPEPIKKKDGTFEEVKHGSRAQRVSDLTTNAPVSVGNRFNSLSGDS